LEQAAWCGACEERSGSGFVERSRSGFVVARVWSYGLGYTGRTSDGLLRWPVDGEHGGRRKRGAEACSQSTRTQMHACTITGRHKQTHGTHKHAPQTDYTLHNYTQCTSIRTCRQLRSQQCSRCFFALRQCSLQGS
jgi:hypothetical protein